MPPFAPVLPQVSVPMEGMSLTVIPPFPFEGMTVRTFPLRANVVDLQRFLDNYLNILPEEVGRFQALAPYVQLMIVDYGKMATKVRNVGWLAQREILFSIPMAWYTVRNGQWFFKDWATIAPFIYVDDDMSMATGRLVYGWPKTTAHLSPTLSEWIKNPRAPIVDATVSTNVFPEMNVGSKLQMREFLSVIRDGPISPFDVPMNLNGPLMPWSIMRNLVTGLAGLGRDAVGLMASAGVLPVQRFATTDNAIAMAGTLMKSSFPSLPGSASNTINLKQFRRSEAPSEFCYQAVTSGPIRLVAFNRGGLLGQDQLALGDLSGGYVIRLHDWPSLPIVDTLGLEVARRWRGDECDLVELKPVLPNWYDVDMVYEAGHNVAWRARDGVWHTPDQAKYPPRLTEGVNAMEGTMFNTTLGSSGSAVAGPFQMANTTIRVLPLLAERTALNTFLDCYLNDVLKSAGERFTLWATDDADDKYAYVYLTVTSFGSVTSPTNNIGDWAKYSLSYLVPVRREQFVADANGTDELNGERGSWEMHGVGLVPAQTLVDSGAAAAANSEVLGIPTEVADFFEPATRWMDSDGPMSEVLQPLLRVELEVAPVLGEGEKMVFRKVVEIAEGAVPLDADQVAFQRVGHDRWAAILRGELQRKKKCRRDSRSHVKTARALARELLGNQAAFSFFTLKQIRDVAAPMCACYQSLVHVQRALREVLDLREIEQPLTVRLFEYPSNPIVKLLGLVTKRIPNEGPGIAHAAQPIRPFWILATADEMLGHPIVFRTGAEDWIHADKHLGGRSPFLSAALVEMDDDNNLSQDIGDPRRFPGIPEDPKPGFQKSIPVGDITEAILKVDPQMVVESLLSREWGNWSDNSRWRIALRDLEAGLKARLAGVPQADQMDAEQKFYDDTADAARARPGRFGRGKGFDDFLARMKKSRAEIERLRSTAEKEWDELAARLKAWKPDGDAKELADLVKPFKDALCKIAESKVIGEGENPEMRADYTITVMKKRLHELVDAKLDPGKESLEALVVACREGIALARDLTDHQRTAFLIRLAKEWQKPDFVVRRDAAGPDRERHFPRAQSWDDDWYAGVAPPDDEKDKPGGQGAASKSRAAASSGSAKPSGKRP